MSPIWERSAGVIPFLSGSGEARGLYLLIHSARVLNSVQWPAVFGRYRRELAPAAALLTTDRELVLISEKRVGIRTRGQAKYGYIATYFPLARLARFGLRRNDLYIILNLDI